MYIRNVFFLMQQPTEIKEVSTMRKSLTIEVAVLMLLIVCLLPNIGCEAARGGADIYLEGITTGAVSMEGKAVSGLPSQNFDVVLKVSATKVTISTVGEETVIKLSPSDASIVIGPDGISVDGVEPDKIEMKWQTSE